MTTLAERVEAADGPDRELDAEIHDSLAQEGHRMHPYLVGTFINDGRSGAVYSCPAYTASIDAAMMLVDDAKCPTVELRRTDDLEWHCALAGNDAHLMAEDPDEWYWEASSCASPALALTAAALHARESKP